VSLATTTAGASIYYTTDGSTPTASSTPFLAPFLMTSSATVNAIAVVAGDSNSTVASQAVAANVASGSVAWSDEFTNSGATNGQPNPNIWTYDVGLDCCGNNEQETYCSWGSNTAPCSSTTPNAFIAPGGGLNIVAMQPIAGTATYTSARLKTEGLFSFEYGRIEAKLMIPESQGMWPAFWLLGNNITTINWPACGELDVMEHIDGTNTPFGGPGTGALPGYDWTQSSIHGTGLNGGTPYNIGPSAAGWHTYGMIWTKGQIQYYVDNPATPYETFSTTSPGTGTWPFDQGPMFILLNLAVGGSWPGNPNSTTVFPSTYQVGYVRVYAN
jgi:beta-glucanase (GH16 family)